LVETFSNNMHLERTTLRWLSEIEEATLDLYSDGTPTILDESCCGFLQFPQANNRIVTAASFQVLPNLSLFIYRPTLFSVQFILTSWNKKLRGLSPQVHYTDLAIAACRRS
jgi:hypothetical protein